MAVYSNALSQRKVEANANALVVSGSYHNYQNGAVSNQLKGVVK
jgi:hypothetical protein